MNAAAHRLEFAPPPVPGFVRAFGLAVFAHLLLLAALTWGVNWRSSDAPFTAEAELWSQVPVQAAPKPVETPPPPPLPAPVVEKPVESPPKAIAPDIVTEREKKRLAAEKKQLETKQQDDKKKELKKQEELKQAEAAKRKDAAAKAEVGKSEEQRQAVIQRTLGLAGATGPATAIGMAQQSAGPSSSYQGILQETIRPNIVFAEDIPSNPMALIEVQTELDGTIKSRKVLKSSGVAAWDEAVIKAIDKTRRLPRDINGLVPSPLEIGFRPKK